MYFLAKPPPQSASLALAQVNEAKEQAAALVAKSKERAIADMAKAKSKMKAAQARAIDLQGGQSKVKCSKEH